MASPNCLRLFVHCARRAASRAACTAGRSKAIKTAMIAMTTRSSISVKPRRRSDMARPTPRNRFGKRLVPDGRALVRPRRKDDDDPRVFPQPLRRLNHTNMAGVGWREGTPKRSRAPIVLDTMSPCLVGFKHQANSTAPESAPQRFPDDVGISARREARE